MENFERFYSQIYGERWSSLLAALKSNEQKVARLNGFSDKSLFHQKFENSEKLNWPCLSSSLPCVLRGWGSEVPRGEEGLLLYYIMDPASILPPVTLDVKPGDRVLDMCAAPGGKTLILAEQLYGDGELIANDISQSRRERLTKVLRQYIPEEKRFSIFVKGRDGVLWGKRDADSFDKILLDAPCSGERHLLFQRNELSKWSEKRTRRLSQRQYSLLASAFTCLKKGGEMVYSTCSISPFENDEVIKKLLKKKSSVELIKLNLDVGESTEFGWQVFPDVTSFGPIYLSKLRKN